MSSQAGGALFRGMGPPEESREDRPPAGAPRPRPQQPEQPRDGEVTLRLALPQVAQKVQLPKVYPYVPLINNQYMQDTRSDRFPRNTRDGSNYGSIGVVQPNAQFNMQPWMAVPNPAIMPNVYNIKIGNLGDPQLHQQMYHIYEESLPHSSRGYSLNSLEERVTLYSYLRSVFVRNGDGEDVGFSGHARGRQHKLNLLSLLKILVFHPYFADRNRKNPYRGIADRMILYECGFPLRLNEDRNYTKVVEVAKNNVRLNLRIYELTRAEEGIGKFNALEGSSFDVWRELAVYEYLRSEVLRKKQCPNFVMLYCYYLTAELRLNFNKLRELKYSARRTLDSSADIAALRREIDERAGGAPATAPAASTATGTAPRAASSKAASDATASSAASGAASAAASGTAGMGLEELKREFNLPSDRTLVLLTESPTKNIVQWATREYRDRVHQRRVSSDGFYNDAVWKNVIFQIICAFYTLTKHGIAFTECSLRDNIYIKSLNGRDTSPTGYWVYNVAGVHYYLQNHGYQVLFDSNFRELDANEGGRSWFKVYSSHLFRDKVPPATIQRMNLLGLANCLSPDNFSGDFVAGGGVRPSNEVLRLLESLHGDIVAARASSLDYLLVTHFREFLHNRIGTLASEDEVRFKKAEPELVDGELVLVEMHNKHVWGLLLAQTPTECRILSNHTDFLQEHIVEMTVPREQVRGINGTVSQRFSGSQRRMTEDERIEMYVL